MFTTTACKNSLFLLSRPWQDGAGPPSLSSALRLSSLLKGITAPHVICLCRSRVQHVAVDEGPYNPTGPPLAVVNSGSRH